MKSMRSFLFFLILDIFVLSPGIADEQISPYKKVYVHPDQISISNDGIFVCLNNHWVQTDALNSDAQGIYVDNVKGFYWRCRHCKYEHNEWYHNCCKRCGRCD